MTLNAIDWGEFEEQLEELWIPSEQQQPLNFDKAASSFRQLVQDGRCSELVDHQ